MKDKEENTDNKTQDDSFLPFFLKALKRKRETFYFFIFIMLIGGIFEAMGDTIRSFIFLSDSFGAVGFSGLLLSLGLQLRSELPSPPFENPDHITYHMIAIIWLIGGVAILFAYVKHFLLPFLK